MREGKYLLDYITMAYCAPACFVIDIPIRVEADFFMVACGVGDWVEEEEISW